ncbi:hypothetical protein QEZ54_05095 [Catellatospora sp. KI3]|uniref:hypothetical protein n=1 Tax=Catellatospora sp. KI3 TaxID=3041620 RepID=UPI002482B70F|nr:hypothetical protein [Catellatospora sp. KI3]MDI1460336.1 hypothetical protein [Catellatospora sp. KI3]
MKSHRTDTVSLFFGLLFLFVAGAFLARRLIHVDLPPLGWFVAAGLIIFGVMGVLGALTPRKRAEVPAADKAVDGDI